MKGKKIIGHIWIYWLSVGLLCAQQPGYTVLQVEPVDRARVTEISAMLPDAPKGFGEPIQKRALWDELYRSGRFDGLIREADSISRLPFPVLSDKIYLDYYQGKDSETSKRFIMNRRRMLSKLVWAECLTDNGRYMPAILNAVKDIVHTTSWTFPAEDRERTNFQGELYTIGLSSSAYGYDMAQTLYLLNERLGAKLQRKVLDALYQKVFKPTLAAIEGNNAKKEFTWLTSTGNHNAVTLAGVTGAALATIRDKRERAVFVAMAERYSNNYVVGISDDGYCSEGLGYYGYGFEHYLLLREHLWQATGGKVDLLARPKMAELAAYAPRMEIINDIYPAIGDCVQDIKPNRLMMAYLNGVYGLGLESYGSPLDFGDIDQMALSNSMFFFPNSSTAAVAEPRRQPRELRHYFANAGVLTVRPADGVKTGLGATFKGGHNNEHHNHNDLGSFTIVVGDELLMGDAGLATYTPQYFGKQRYELYKTTSSYGHTVPLVSGKQQLYSRQAEAKVIRTAFHDDKDLISMDISSAYGYAKERTLVRTFTYHRQHGGRVEASDAFAFDSPQRYETALITRHKWKAIGKDEIAISGERNTLRIKIEIPQGNSLIIDSEEIDEGPKPYTRIAIKLKEPVTTGKLDMEFLVK